MQERSESSNPASGAAPHPTPSVIRLLMSGVINIVLLIVPIMWLSGTLMDLAAAVLGEPVAWPQIAFMSAYPDNVRNGYGLFVTAIFLCIFLASGVFAALCGASPGKMLLGIRFKDSNQMPASSGRLMLRAALLIAVLAPIFVTGPVIGFVFGPSADGVSLFALGASSLLTAVFLFPRPKTASLLNRAARLTPCFRRAGIRHSP